MNFKLIAIDLDETLLTSQKSISEDNKKTIQKAIDKGIKVVLCTGRGHNAMYKFVEFLGLSGNNQFIITNGGASIEDLSGRILFSRMLNNQFYREFVQFLNNNDLHYNVVDVHGNTYTSNNGYIDPNTIKQANENAHGLYIRTPDQLPDDFEIVKAIITGTKEEMDKSAGMIHEHYDNNYFVVRTGDGFIEVFPKGINKGTALTRLAKHLNISLDQVMAIGDQDNDISMFNVSGLAVAMKNAAEGPKLASDVLTDDNNHDGVGKAIEKYAL